MILCKRGGKLFLVNCLANFIVDKIGDNYSSIIRVFDFENFIILKGKTNSKEILNLNEVLIEFDEKYKNVSEFSKIKNTIDLIEYDCEIKELDKLSLTLYNSDKCDYHYNQIDLFKENDTSNDFCSVVSIIEDESVSQSQFPYGYSFNQGKSLYFFIKKIFYSLPSNYPFTSLNISVDVDKKENFIKVFNLFNQDYDEIIESAILDSLDFNIQQVTEKMKKMDSDFDLLNPLEERPYLLEGKKFLII